MLTCTQLKSKNPGKGSWGGNATPCGPAHSHSFDCTETGCSQSRHDSSECWHLLLRKLGTLLWSVWSCWHMRSCWDWLFLQVLGSSVQPEVTSCDVITSLQLLLGGWGWGWGWQFGMCPRFIWCTPWFILYPDSGPNPEPYSTGDMSILPGQKGSVKVRRPTTCPAPLPRWKGANVSFSRRASCGCLAPTTARQHRIRV